jgi:uncharacterized protein (TIGR02231 family)
VEVIFMKTLLSSLVLAATVLILPPLSTATTITRIQAPSTITQVTVYRDRAQVTRTATLNLKAGSQIITIAGLPVLLQDDSVRVDAKGTARATITGIEVKRAFLPQIAEKRVKTIEDELKVLERKLGNLDAKKAGLTSQKGFIDSIRVAWGQRISQQLAAGKPTSSELTEALGFVGNGMTRVEDQSRDIDLEKQVIKEKMAALQRQKNEVTGSDRKETKSIEIAVETTKEGTLTIDMSGVVSQATWEPSYDVRLAADGLTAQLTYRALVKQQTGEDWNNAELALSTARPASGGAPPALHPWHISFYRPMPLAMSAPAPRFETRMYKKAAKALMPENMADMAVAEEVPAPAAFQTAQAATEGTSIVFRIPKLVDIPSDNTQHSTVIALEKLPVSTEYTTVPKLSSTAYLTAELVNKAGWPLLPGSVKIFSGNTFVGSAEMKQVASGEKFTLPFGSDDQMIIKREELKQHKQAGMFGANRMGYRSTITVSNLRKETQTISVKDQLPLAGDSEIKVSLEDATLQPTEKKDDGTLVWKLKLTAGEKKEFRYEVVVEYPKDREVTGL